jgi:hypothetical protein
MQIPAKYVPFVSPVPQCNKRSYTEYETAAQEGHLGILLSFGEFDEKYFHNLPFKFQDDPNQWTHRDPRLVNSYSF